MIDHRPANSIAHCHDAHFTQTLIILLYMLVMGGIDYQVNPVPVTVIPSGAFEAAKKKTLKHEDHLMSVRRGNDGGRRGRATKGRTNVSGFKPDMAKIV
jgi:hypothetical protein